MCGITGAAGTTLDRVEESVSALHHRGPDGRGVWWSTDRVACLGHTRLAILDLSSAASQPMVSDDGMVSLVFNGEIYNFSELRKQLEACGVGFRTSGDTEVILKGYLKWGRKVIDRLRGMFAFAIWDSRTNELIVARDRLGIKPLFYSYLNGTLRFASELGALLCQFADTPRLRRDALVEYLTWLYVPPPKTFYEGLNVLPPGHLLTWKLGSHNPSIERYWQPPRSLHLSSFEESAWQLRSMMEDSIRLHMVSDVPVGAFLSGGLDSSSIVALMAQHSSKPVRTFCMTFSNDANAYDERVYAQQVASHFGTVHEEIPVTPDIAELLPQTLKHFSQPFGNPTALLIYELSRLMRQHVKVALSGDGGDELMLGYPRYQGVGWHQVLTHLPDVFRSALTGSGAWVKDSSKGLHIFRRAREFLKSIRLSSVDAYASWVSYLDHDELTRLLTPEYRAEIPDQPWSALTEKIAQGPRNDLTASVARADLESFLPDNLLAYSDRMSMAHGLELRVPFCDHVLAEYCASLPSDVRMKSGQSKALMKAAMKDVLPANILHRPKLGFNPPMGLWLSKDLKPLLNEYLSEGALKKAGMIDPVFMKNTLAEHDAGYRDHSLKIWGVLVLQVWNALSEHRHSP